MSGIESYTYYAPGRVCLFGDHQDYLGLPVIACAIDRSIKLQATPNDTESFNISMPDIHEERQISIHESFERFVARDYFASCLNVLRKWNFLPDKGFDIEITGDIPINSGLSSSSALCTAWISFLISTFGDLVPSAKELALLTYEAEVLKHKEPGGNMDQFAISYGGLMKIETQVPYSAEQINLDIPGLLIGNSGVSKTTLDLLQEIKEQSMQAIEFASQHIPEFQLYQTNSDELRNYISYVPTDLQAYLIAAIENHDITKSALQLLYEDSPDWKSIGQLMNQHQAVLRDQLGVSITLLDNMIEAALSAGAYGAKLVGSGGGGCIVAIAPGKETEVRDAILKAGAIEAFSIQIDKGAHELNSFKDKQYSEANSIGVK